MNDEVKKTFETLCAMLDGIKWKYKRDDEKLTVTTSAIGKDLTMPLRIVVSGDRHVMYVKSAMTFSVPEHKRATICYATTLANFSMLNGCFEFNMENGYLGFRIVVPFEGSVVGEETCRYMVMLTCQMVDKFNDKFKKLVDDEMSMPEFVKFVQPPKLPQA